MNKIEELEKQAKSILEEIEKLKNEEKVESKVWKPKENEDYYYISSNVICYADIWEKGVCDEDRYEIGNCFKTKEEAEKTVEKAKIYTQLKRLAEENNTEPIDWEDTEQRKYYIEYSYYYKEFEKSCGYSVKDTGIVYCTNENFLSIALERIGEENLLKLFKE